MENSTSEDIVLPLIQMGVENAVIRNRILQGEMLYWLFILSIKFTCETTTGYESIRVTQRRDVVLSLIKEQTRPNCHIDFCQLLSQNKGLRSHDSTGGVRIRLNQHNYHIKSCPHFSILQQQMGRSLPAQSITFQSRGQHN